MDQSKIKSRLLVDIILIFAITFAFYGVYYIYKDEALAFFSDKNNDILLRSFLLDFLHFGQGGLATIIVIAFRKEKLEDLGLTKKNLFPTLTYSSILLLAYWAIVLIRGPWRLFYPFRAAFVYDEMLSAPFHTMVFGMLAYLLVYGFVEGYNYAYISKKINRRWPVKNIFLSPGPIILSILGFLAHSIVGVSGWAESLQLLFVIYGMLIIYEKTENAWGCIFLFSLIWNTL